MATPVQEISAPTLSFSSSQTSQVSFLSFSYLSCLSLQHLETTLMMLKVIHPKIGFREIHFSIHFPS